MTTHGTQGEPGGLERARRWLFGTPAWLQAAFDLIGVALCIGTVLGAAPADLLLHGVWLILALDAFTFGLRPTATRIVLATAVVAIHAATSGTLDLTEWPLMVVISVVVAVMADRLHETSQRYASLYRQTNNRLVTAQEDERRRMARDLHDGVGQTLTAMALTLDAAESMLWAGENPPSNLGRGAIARAQELAAHALREAHDVALQLRPARLHETGLVASATELAQRVGSPVEVRVNRALVRPGLLPIETEVEALRIVQEALANSVRHAHATNHWFAASTVPGAIRLEVGDDGVGFDPSARDPRGLGLAGMADRASLIGAELWVVSARGQGTVVTLDVPRPAEGATGELDGAAVPTHP